MSSKWREVLTGVRAHCVVKRVKVHNNHEPQTVGEPDSLWLMNIFHTISSGWNTSSNCSAVKKPSATQASFREIFSLKAFFAVLAAFS